MCCCRQSASWMDRSDRAIVPASASRSTTASSGSAPWPYNACITQSLSERKDPSRVLLRGFAALRASTLRDFRRLLERYLHANPDRTRKGGVRVNVFDALDRFAGQARPVEVVDVR